MKKLCASLLMLSLAAFIGCGPGSNTGGGTGGTSKVGGPGAKDATDRGGPVVGQKEGTFSLDPPNLETTVKQGESKVVEIGISRGTNFDQNVSLKFEGAPKGVTIDPANATINKGEKSAKITVKAAEDAALGDHTVKVVGKPESGPEATNTFNIEVQTK